METCRRISLIDTSPRNRAWFVQLFAQAGRHVEPYEDVMELYGVTRFEGVFLICDTGDLFEEVIATIEPKVNPVAVIAYSDELNIRRMFHAVRAGAFDYLVGVNLEMEPLFKAVQLAELSIKRDIAEWNREASALARALTNREQQILELTATGATSHEIGSLLGISHRTVEIHRANMHAKLGALNAPHAVRIGADIGLFT